MFESHLAKVRAAPLQGRAGSLVKQIGFLRPSRDARAGGSDNGRLPLELLRYLYFHKQRRRGRRLDPRHRERDGSVLPKECPPSRGEIWQVHRRRQENQAWRREDIVAEADRRVNIRVTHRRDTGWHFIQRHFRHFRHLCNVPLVQRHFVRDFHGGGVGRSLRARCISNRRLIKCLYGPIFTTPHRTKWRGVATTTRSARPRRKNGDRQTLAKIEFSENPFRNGSV